MQSHLGQRCWVWSGHEVVLVTDVHADAEALLDSLEAAGLLERHGSGVSDFELTPRGRAVTLVLAGDFLDKGPANLELLRTVRHVRDAGVSTVVLAGNHDIRTLVGVSSLGSEDPRLSHMFVRMGKKSVRLFHEIHREHTGGRSSDYHDLNDDQIRVRIAPSVGWSEAFPRLAREYLSEAKIARELARVEEKHQQLLDEVECCGMTLADYYAAVCAFRGLFLDAGAEFGWLFDEMRLAYRQGSVLFLHAGVDDTIARQLREQGHQGLNSAFCKLVSSGRWFELYNGPVGNVFRTKYRSSELPLSRAGAADLAAAGILAIAHGHRSITSGQRMILRQGLLHFECDASIDRNTRALAGLSAGGAAATIFRRDARVVAISSDYPSCRVFDPAHFCPVTIA